MNQKEGGNMGSGLSGKIFNEIRKDIINEAYPIGSRILTERELAQRYKASRFAVREAIAMLSQNGFVETYPQSGTYVKDFYRDGSLDTLVQILRIRRAIDRQTLDSLLKFRFTSETDAAFEAACRATDSDILVLAGNLKKKEAHLADIPVLTECDYAFHYKIIAVSGNIISKLVFQSFRPIYSFFSEFFYALPGAPETSLALNLKLLEALKRGVPASASAAMGEILKFAEKKVYEAIDESKQLIVIGSQ
jgi:GntR family transcriptional regulator, transcriptional repressor for pyruvate dehydrogenase complex